jgi:hypothetical protein
MHMIPRLRRDLQDFSFSLMALSCAGVRLGLTDWTRHRVWTVDLGGVLRVEERDTCVWEPGFS